MICENCGIEHDGTYGSGRFCSLHCNRSYSGKKNKGKQIGHKNYNHNYNSNYIKSEKYNKPGICKFCNKEYKNQNSLRQHEIRCKLNPDRLNINYIEYRKGWHHSEETKRKISEKARKRICTEETRQKLSKNNGSHKKEVKLKISESMKKAHKEGRAWNIGKSRWNNEPSYPEKWLMGVLYNEFNFERNKNYIKEFPFHKYSLDFAWPEKKLCIELDGRQHDRQDQKRRDIEKDKLLKEEGWIELRVKWQDILKDKQKFINDLGLLFKKYYI